MDCSHCGARPRHAARGSTRMGPESCPPECRQRMGLFLDPRGAECREPSDGPLACGMHASGGLDEAVGAPSGFRWSNRLTSFCFCG